MVGEIIKKIGGTKVKAPPILKLSNGYFMGFAI